MKPCGIVLGQIAAMQPRRILNIVLMNVGELWLERKQLSPSLNFYGISGW